MTFQASISLLFEFEILCCFEKCSVKPNNVIRICFNIKTFNDTRSDINFMSMKKLILCCSVSGRERYMCHDMTWQNQQNECAHSEDSDQTGRPSLIRVFAVCMKKPWALSYPLSAERRLWSDWADAQANLSLRWVHIHFVGFVMSWLISEQQIWQDRSQICLLSWILGSALFAILAARGAV